MNNIELSENNKKILQNKISRAINAIPDEHIQEIFLDYIRNEVDNLYSEGCLEDMIKDPVRELLRDIFIEKGLLKK